MQGTTATKVGEAHGGKNQQGVIFTPDGQYILGQNKYPPAKPEVLRLLAPQRGLTAIAKSKPKTEQTTNGRLPELSNFGSPPAEPGVYHD